MAQPLRLERRHYHETFETWLNIDADGAWKLSSDVCRVWVKSAHDYTIILETSAASAFVGWLRRHGQAHEAAAVHWRWTHGAGVPPLAPSPTGTISVLTNQLPLFDGL